MGPGAVRPALPALREWLRRPGRRHFAAPAALVAVALDLPRELLGDRSIERSRSAEASRARSVTPFRRSVASATFESAIEGFFSTSSSTSSWARSETCLTTRPNRSSTCSRKLSVTAVLRPRTSILIGPPPWSNVARLLHARPSASALLEACSTSEREGHHPVGAGRAQFAGACVERRAGGVDVVDQHQRAAAAGGHAGAGARSRRRCANARRGPGPSGRARDPPARAGHSPAGPPPRRSRPPVRGRVEPVAPAQRAGCAGTGTSVPRSRPGGARAASSPPMKPPPAWRRARFSAATTPAGALVGERRPGRPKRERAAAAFRAAARPGTDRCAAASAARAGSATRRARHARHTASAGELGLAGSTAHSGGTSSDRSQIGLRSAVMGIGKPSAARGVKQQAADATIRAG